MNTEFVKKIRVNLFRNIKQEKINIYKIDNTIKKCIYCNKFHDIKYNLLCFSYMNQNK